MGKYPPPVSHHLNVLKKTRHINKNSEIWVNNPKMHTKLSLKDQNLFPESTAQFFKIADIYKNNLPSLQKFHFNSDNMYSAYVDYCKVAHYLIEGTQGTMHYTTKLYIDNIQQVNNIIFEFKTSRITDLQEMREGLCTPFYKTLDVVIEKTDEVSGNLNDLGTLTETHLFFTMLTIYLLLPVPHVVTSPDFASFYLCWQDVISSIELGGSEVVNIETELFYLLDIVTDEICFQQGIERSELHDDEETMQKFIIGLEGMINNFNCTSWEIREGKKYKVLEFVDIKKYDKLMYKSTK